MTVSVVLGCDRDGEEVEVSFDFVGPCPQVGDTLLCYVWPSRLDDPDSEEPARGEKRDFVRFRVVGRDFTFMRDNRHPEPQITDAYVFVEKVASLPASGEQRAR